MTNQPAQELKPWPKRVSKRFLHEVYRLSYTEMQRTIFFAVAKANKTKGLKTTKHKHYVTPKQLEIIIEELGDAPGYMAFKG